MLGVASLHHSEGPGRKRCPLPQRAAPAVIRAAADLRSGPCRHQYLLQEAGQVHISSRDLLPVLCPAVRWEIIVVHVDHVAGKEPPHQVSQAALAAAAAAVNGHDGWSAAPRQPGRRQQCREVPAVCCPQDPVVGVIRLPVGRRVVDGRTALTAVHRQPVRHTGQGQRLRRGQAFLQVRRRPVVLRRRQKQQIRQERRSQRPIPRPRQMNAAQTVPDPLRRPGLPVCGKGAALPQQLPEDISPFPRCMGWTERTLIGQLGAVLGLHQRIAGQVLPQDRLKFLMHLFSPPAAVVLRIGHPTRL